MLENSPLELKQKKKKSRERKSEWEEKRMQNAKAEQKWDKIFDIED